LRDAPGPASNRAMVTLHIFDEAGYRQSQSLDDLPALIAAGTRVWIDASGVDDRLTTCFTDVLRLHPLAVEDILRDRPSPKVEDYGEYLYVVVHGIVRDKSDPESLQTVELDIVLTSSWVLTHHTSPSSTCEAVAQELSRNARPLERGPGFIAHAVLDHLVDYYLPVMDAFDEDVDEIEGAVIDDPSREVLQRLFRLKRSLQRLRRIAVYQREVLKRLSRGEFEQIPEATLPFFRDVYDHFARVADLADGYRELLSGALDAYLSMISNRMNEVMKALTLVSTVMLPLTFIAGIYGMNFEHMPELKWVHGYPFALALMSVVAVAMVWWFRRQRWL